MKELEELKHFLGVEVNHITEGLLLCQQKYAKFILPKFWMKECKPIPPPM